MPLSVTLTHILIVFFTISSSKILLFSPSIQYILLSQPNKLQEKNQRKTFSAISHPA